MQLFGTVVCIYLSDWVTIVSTTRPSELTSSSLFLSSEEVSFGENSDSDEDILFRSDHDTNSEEDTIDSEIYEAPENANNFYIGKNITHCTNIYIETIRDKFQRSRDARFTDVTEIRAFIGLLYQIGSFRCSRKNIHQLWDNSKGNGMESCYLTMSEKRFRFLVRCLRFDDVRDRVARKQFDKLAPIRDIFTMMVDNFQKYYCVSEYVTTDEQLLAFRGKCPFRQYIPSKPSKYGKKYAIY
ncbi:piggyBac transposable element-derived protein 4-like [Acyrthosiphon pisum]|uniref:PiggyBac transposable element-derived protein domain-containing protein n=1 Tax=Acyrthosiphon pisum TaxID=7029 RepID=A0A8R1WXN0_ACYPI|nr:piggyBac transposable element-derived protein 4-like [Acyrthosiphon pisum]|eukprot:XP_008178411.1 PREDICTED: piggyBac transposable element-derived protein 4-like [Acyrthosiphon pisum]